MTEPTRDAHGRTHASLEHTLHTYRKAWEDEKRKRAELEAEVASHAAYKLSLLDALGPGVEGRSVPDAIRALRAKAEIVDAMERGEIELHRADLHAPGEPRTQWVCVNTTTHFGYRGTTARDALAAYAAATREGTDAK